MKKTLLSGGLGIALATPFDSEGNIDYPAFERLIDYVSGKDFADAMETYSKDKNADTRLLMATERFWHAEAGGADFLIVLGSTGEGATVEPEERRELIIRAVNKKTGLPIVVGTGSNSTAQCLRLTSEAVALGADAVLVVVPYYNKPTPEGIRAHFRAVAGSAEGKPLIVYNVPSRTGINLTPQVLSSLWDIPNIVAVKESSGNLSQIGEISRTLPEGKMLLSGDDALALPSIALGAEGLISVAGNVFPRKTKQLIDAAIGGRRMEALALHKQLLPFMDALFIESNPIPLKASLAILGFCTDTVRLPLAPASEITKQKLSKLLGISC